MRVQVNCVKNFIKAIKLALWHKRWSWNNKMVGCEVAPAPPHPLAPAVRYRRDQGIIKRHARHRTTTATGITDRKGCLHFSHITRCINVIDLKSLRHFALFPYAFEAITEDLSISFLFTPGFHCGYTKCKACRATVWVLCSSEWVGLVTTSRAEMRRRPVSTNPYCFPNTWH